MNIKCQGYSLTLVQGHSDLTFSNFFSLKTAQPIEAKFNEEPSWDKGMKACSNCLGHMTNMADVPIYGQILQNLLLWNQKAMTLKVMQNQILMYYQVCSNNDFGLTLIYFTARSNLLLYGKT